MRQEDRRRTPSESKIQREARRWNDTTIKHKDRERHKLQDIKRGRVLSKDRTDRQRGGRQ